jgi:tetratricopeptide (TPR) repeat protein
MKVRYWPALLLLSLLPCADVAAGPGADDFNLGFQYQSGDGVAVDLDMAQRYYKRSLDKEPGLFPALYNTALIYYAKERFKDARLFFVKAAKSAQNSSSEKDEALARNGIGTCHQKSDLTAKAEAEFTAAIQLEPSFVEAHFNFINLLVSQERPDEASEAMERARHFAPSDRYEIFEGRMRGRESRAAWGSIEIKIGIAVMVAALFLYWVYMRAKSK